MDDLPDCFAFFQPTKNLSTSGQNLIAIELVFLLLVTCNKMLDRGGRLTKLRLPKELTGRGCRVDLFYPNVASRDRYRCEHMSEWEI